MDTLNMVIRICLSLLLFLALTDGRPFVAQLKRRLNKVNKSVVNDESWRAGLKGLDALCPITTGGAGQETDFDTVLLALDILNKKVTEALALKLSDAYFEGREHSLKNGHCPIDDDMGRRTQKKIYRYLGLTELSSTKLMARFKNRPLVTAVIRDDISDIVDYLSQIATHISVSTAAELRFALSHHPSKAAHANVSALQTESAGILKVAVDILGFIDDEALSEKCPNRSSYRPEDTMIQVGIGLEQRFVHCQTYHTVSLVETKLEQLQRHIKRLIRSIRRSRTK